MTADIHLTWAGCLDMLHAAHVVFKYVVCACACVREKECAYMCACVCVWVGLCVPRQSNGAYYCISAQMYC